MATSPNATPDPRNAVIASGKREVQITASQVQPPTPLYLQKEDSLQLTILNPLFLYAFPILLLIRWLRPDGEIVSVLRRIPSVLGQTVYHLTLGEGFLLSATLAPPDQSIPEPGAIFAVLAVRRDDPEAQFLHMVLFADYLATNHFPTWPYGKSIFPQDGPGALRIVVGTTPALGAEISESNSAFTRRDLLSVVFSLTTSAVVNTRKSSLAFDTPATIYSRLVALQNVVASSSIIYSWAVDAAGAYDGVTVSTSLPTPVSQPPNGRFRTITQNLDAGDQYSAPVYLFREWIDE